MKGKDGKKYFSNARHCSFSHLSIFGCPNNTIFTKFGKIVDLTCVMTCANFGWYRLKGGHFAAVQNVPFSHDINGWPYNRQALTCCRDTCPNHVPTTLGILVSTIQFFSIQFKSIKKLDYLPYVARLFVGVGHDGWRLDGEYSLK